MPRNKDGVHGDGDVNGKGKGKGSRVVRGEGGRGGVSRGRGSSSLDAVPDQYLCPISLQVMNDPVTTADGHAYERVHIEAWLQTNNTSPSTGARLEHKNLTPAIALRQLIEGWRSSMGGV